MSRKSLLQFIGSPSEYEYMGCKLHRLIALIVSVAAHIALGVAFGVDGDRQPDTHMGQRASPYVLTVRLNKQGDVNAAPMPVSSEHALHDKKTGDGPMHSLSAPPRSSEGSSFFPVLTQPEPHYFQLKELTEKPHVVLDISSNLTVNSLTESNQPIILSLLINEHGDIDRVNIDGARLPDDVENLLVNAFSKTKFSPGRINDVAVKSQMTIEVLLENIASQTP